MRSFFRSLFGGLTDEELSRFNNTKKKAEDGDSIAQCELAQLYFKNNKDYFPPGVDQYQGLEQGLKWMRKSAEQGYIWGQYFLGQMLLYSSVIVYPNMNVTTSRFHNKEEGLKWMLKAAEQGALNPCAYLGRFYSDSLSDNLSKSTAHGTRGVKDYTQAVHWYRKAIEMGCVQIAEELAPFYRDGKGVEKDAVQAYVLFNLAADSEEAAEQRDELEKTMTSQQVVAAQKKTNELRAQIQKPR